VPAARLPDGSGARLDARPRAVHTTDPDDATANFEFVAHDLDASAGIQPEDVDLAQIYENLTGGVLISLVAHGFCAPVQAEAFGTRPTSTGWGGLPINTRGGNIADSTCIESNW